MHTTIEETVHDRMGRGLSDLLLMLFDMGVHYGLGQPWETPAAPSAAALAETIKARWHSEMSAMRAWKQGETPGEIPEWLQAAIALHTPSAREVGDEEPVWVRAHAERLVAFGPAPLPPTGNPRRTT